MSPSIHHRILFRHGEKRYLVRIANRFAILAMAVARGRIHRDPDLGLRRRRGWTRHLVFGGFASAVGIFVLWFGLPLAGWRMRVVPARRAAFGVTAIADPDKAPAAE